MRAAAALDRAGIDRIRVEVVLSTVDPATITVHAASRCFRMIWAPGISAVAMPWAIYVHPDRLAADALTHIDQWRRLGPIGWARAYVGDYVRGRLRGLSHHNAYRAIGLEEEARDVARRIAG